MKRIACVFLLLLLLLLAAGAHAQQRFTYGGSSVFSANYMFSLRPNNPLVDLFYSLIPHPYWYMYLVLPIVVVYLLIIYTPELIRFAKEKK